MGTMTNSGKAVVTLPSDTEILITRSFDAPKELVFKAWTTPELIARWWAGQRGTVTSIEVDLRVGGRWRYVMVANEGFEVAFHGEYREIVPNERIRYTDRFDDPNLPGVIEVTVQLKAVSCGTEINIEQANLPPMIPVESCYLGWQQSLAQLALLVEPNIPG